MIDTYGVDPVSADSRFAQECAPHQYLQEVRSAIMAIRALLDAI